MADSAALLVDDVLPNQPMRQWVLGNCSRHGSTSHIHVVVSVPFPLRFLFASQPAVMGKVLGVIYRTIATHLTHKAGFTKPLARTGAVTLIQRFGGALNLNIHFHMLFLDGVFIGGANGQPMRFLRVKTPTKAELTQITRTIAHRVARYLERQGLLERDTGNIYLTPEAVEKVRPGTGREAGLGHASDEDPSNQLLGSSITYRIAVGRVRYELNQK